MTEAVKHTPGIWHAEHERGPKNQHGTASTGIWSQAKFDFALDYVNDGTDPMDAAWICGIWGELSPEDFANARLIAAAPDLLKALQYARRFLRGIDHDVDYVDGVIAKAEGR